MAKHLAIWMLVLLGATYLSVQAEVALDTAGYAIAETVASSADSVHPYEFRKPTGSTSGIDEF